jgi:hypothetical protein
MKRELGAQAVFLFGSRARGEELEGSDYDFLVVSEKFERVPFIKRAALVRKTIRGSRISVDVLCYTPGEFRRKKAELCVVREAVRTGIRIA